MEFVIVTFGLVAAVAAVLWPLLRRDAAAPDPTIPAGEEGSSDAEVARDVDRYREALRASTICRRCAQADPPDSRFCSECGRPLRRRHVDEKGAARA